MARTYEPIASTTVGTATATITISNIPGTYTDLVLVASGLIANYGSYQVRVNGDTSSIYSYTYLYGDGTSAASGRNSADTSVNTVIQGTPGPVVGQFHFMSYANTNVFKTILASGGASSHLVTRSVGLWRSTSAINSITVFSIYNFNTGSTFSLYGVRAA